MGPLCTSGVPSCLPDPDGLVVAVDDTAISRHSRFQTTPPKAGEQPVFSLYLGYTAAGQSFYSFVLILTLWL